MRGALVDARVGDLFPGLFRAPALRTEPVRESWVNICQLPNGVRFKRTFASERGAQWHQQRMAYVLYRIHVIPKGGA